jgi:hypothetical protein
MTQLQYVEWLFRLLAFIGGVVSTVVGSWVSSKIHVFHENRRAHRDELKAKVLIPLRDCLEVDFTPVVTLQQAAVCGRWDNASFVNVARSTENQNRFELVLEAVHPWQKFKVDADPALYQDARKKHFPELLNGAEDLASAWEDYAGQVRLWIEEISQQLSRSTDLPPMKGGSAVGAFIDSGFLALFVYKRLCRLQAPSLTKRSSGGELWELQSGGTTVALGPAHKLNELTDLVDAVIAGQEKKSAFFAGRAKELERQLETLKDEVRLALATTRLRKQCDLVTFF